MFNILIKLLFSILLFVGIVFPIHAQINLLGKPGYIKVPSAQWDEQPAFSFNVGYLPRENTVNKLLWNNNGIPYNSRITLTNYLEISLNFLYLLDKWNNGIGDRQMDARLLLKKETKYFPGVAVILSFPFASNHWSAYNAVSFTKNFSFWGMQLQTTAGYSPSYYFGVRSFYTPNGFVNGNLGFHSKLDVGNTYLNGFFTGLIWKPVPWAGIMADYDTRDVNAGLWIGYNDRIGLQYHLYGLKNSGGNFYIKIPLNFESLELRRFRKSSKKQGI